MLRRMFSAWGTCRGGGGGGRESGGKGCVQYIDQLTALLKTRVEMPWAICILMGVSGLAQINALLGRGGGGGVEVIPELHGGSGVQTFVCRIRTPESRSSDERNVVLCNDSTSFKICSNFVPSVV